MNNKYNKPLNLNYLRVFNAVYKSRSMQKAAQHLGITQSAVSQTLAKLRDYTGDKLFYSVGNTLQSTQRADTLGKHLDMQIKLWDEKLNEQSFGDPKSFSGELTIAISSVLLEALATELTSSLVFNLFPQAKLNITIWNDDTPNDILEGKVHLGLNIYPTELPKFIRTTPIVKSHPVILSRLGHPIGDADCSLEDFQRYPKGGIFIPGLPDYGAKLMRSYPELFDFAYRSASMSVLVNLVEHSELLVIAESISATMAQGKVCFHQAPWLADYIPPHRHHALYYLEKNHNTPLYDYCVKAIKDALKPRLDLAQHSARQVNMQ